MTQDLTNPRHLTDMHRDLKIIPDLPPPMLPEETRQWIWKLVEELRCHSRQEVFDLESALEDKECECSDLQDTVDEQAVEISDLKDEIQELQDRLAELES